MGFLDSRFAELIECVTVALMVKLPSYVSTKRLVFHASRFSVLTGLVLVSCFWEIDALMSSLWLPESLLPASNKTKD